MIKTRNVGVVGLGAIGRAVCRALDAGIPGLRLAGALARDRERAERFLHGLAGRPPFLPLDDLIAASELVVEASTQAHLEEIAPKALGLRRGLVVLAALSLAGIGPEKTRIRIYAVPGLQMNAHRVTMEGEFGRLAVEIENVPSENPRTGKLSYLSTIALLRDLGASLRVGT